MAKLPATRDNSGDYSAIRELLAWWKVMEAPKQFQRFPWHVPSFSLNFVEPMVCDLCLFPRSVSLLSMASVSMTSTMEWVCVKTRPKLRSVTCMDVPRSL